MIHETPDPKSLFETALQLHARGDLESASVLYGRALDAKFDKAQVLTKLGLLRLQQKNFAEAERCLDQAVLLVGPAAEAHTWRGEVWRQQGNLNAAVDEFEAALSIRPNFAPALFNLGLAREGLGDPAAAKAAWLQFLGQRPDDARVRRELGRLAQGQADYQEAQTWYSQQLARFPDDEDTACDLAAALVADQAFAEAAVLLDSLLRRRPGNARAQLLRGRSLLSEGRAGEALAWLRQCAESDPDDVDLMYEVARSYDHLAQLEEAIRWFEKASTLAPERADIRNALAVAHLNLGDSEAAVTLFREAIRIRPAFREAHSNLLLALHYVDPVDIDALFTEHRSWALQHAGSNATLRTSFRNGSASARRLRIGYVSPRFCGGPLMHFFLPLLEAHDAARFDVTCYATSTAHDAATELMRARADGWRECARSDDAELASLVRDDAIDILVDLAGHCPGNRLGLFARRAAPIQVTWMDYVDTTGLRTMDYILTDERHSPAEGEQRFTETVIRLPYTRLCYRPLDPMPPIASSSVHGADRVTFGCFNRLSKVGAGVIETWSRIMARVPGSRLVLKSTAFASLQTRELIAQRFYRHGIDPSRLDLRPFSSELEMMVEYNEVDIVLDPFPYNGCTSTCDALSMGVHVVTLEGRTLAGRHGVSLLGLCGLEDWIAHSRDEYVEIACEAARNVARLRSLRNEMRDRFFASALCDGSQFAGDVEAAYRIMWSAWCGERLR
jgi:protein O-GlcNAc transferase